MNKINKNKIFFIKCKKKYKLIIFIFTILFFLFHKVFIKKDIKVCLCAIAKNENLYIREFVEHYKRIDYDNIFIYDNNDKDGENFNEVIDDYIKSGFVEIINYRERDMQTTPLFDAYKDCYSRNKKKYNWLSFFDVDEFLELNEKYKTIKEFLKDDIFEKCKNIKINWLVYKNYNSLYYENKPLQERIKTFSYNYIENIQIKSTVKGNLYLNYWETISNPHTSNLKIYTCSSSGKKIQFNSPFNFPPDYSNAKLKHYIYKSFEEYCIKIKRGKSDHPKNTSNNIKTDLYKDLYYESKNNPDKLKIINKIFNYSLYNNDMV